MCRDRGPWCRGDRGSRCVAIEDRGVAAIEDSGVSRSRIAVCHASRIEDRGVPRCRDRGSRCCDRGSRCREQLQATEILVSAPDPHVTPSRKRVWGRDAFVKESREGLGRVKHLLRGSWVGS